MPKDDDKGIFVGKSGFLYAVCDADSERPEPQLKEKTQRVEQNKFPHGNVSDPALVVVFAAFLRGGGALALLVFPHGKQRKMEFYTPKSKEKTPLLGGGTRSRARGFALSTLRSRGNGCKMRGL